MLKRLAIYVEVSSVQNYNFVFIISCHLKDVVFTQPYTKETTELSEKTFLQSMDRTLSLVRCSLLRYRRALTINITKKE